MNQIIYYKNKKIIYYFYFQLIISIIAICIFLFYYKTKNNKLDNQILINASLIDVYNLNDNETIFGNLIIDKINLKTSILNEYSKENLKISVCKFKGNNINQNGNITIIGHNYNDERFFGKLYKLEKNDIIKIRKNENEYFYRIIKKYETDSNDLNCLDPMFLNTKEITLITCINNKKNKRLIIKALLILFK